MQVETLKDVVHWTAGFHRQLSQQLQEDANKSVSERARLLLGYLSEHENSLAETLYRFETEGINQALNTWCYDYLDKHPVTRYNAGDRHFAELAVDDIMAELVRVNEQVLDLYRNLCDRARTPEARELLQSLLNLEEHEAMRMSQGANRLRDI